MATMDMSTTKDRRSTRAAMVVLAVLTVLGSVVLAIVTPVTAEAQAGSRICGAWWKAYPNNGETELIYAQVIEVPKTDGVSCKAAADRLDHIDQLFRLKPEWRQYNWGQSMQVWKWKCEHLGAVFNGKYGNDPCLNMKRADHLSEARDRSPSHFVNK
ncbi:hypothetical protein [Saccharothrix deserti]|uniref:hypothetical protein n=1 Tax=Saccharothrix deserti TaxID=2593674 RepID=UPI00131CA919|nr:hypothetical protein [Saccharothrix deserti]